MRKKLSKTNRVWGTFGASRRNAQRQWGVGGWEILSRIICQCPTRLVPLLRTEDGAADSKRYAHSAGPAHWSKGCRAKGSGRQVASVSLPVAGFCLPVSDLRFLLISWKCLLFNIRVNTIVSDYWWSGGWSRVDFEWHSLQIFIFKVDFWKSRKKLHKSFIFGLRDVPLAFVSLRVFQRRNVPTKCSPSFFYLFAGPFYAAIAAQNFDAQQDLAELS